MFPVEASRELQFRVFHRLANKQYVLTVQLHSGDDIVARVLEPFQQGRLPSCLYRSTLEQAVLVVRESLVEHEALPVRASAARHSDAPHGAQMHVARSSRGSLLPSAPGSRPSACGGLRWPLLMQNASSTPSLREATFWCACEFLLRHRPTFFRTVGTLEESYVKAIREKQAGRLAAISELQRCQSMEMEKVRQQAEKDECESGDVQSVVAQHVSEIDALELHWRTEIEQLKERQRTTYREYVVDFFESEVTNFEKGIGTECVAQSDGHPVDLAAVDAIEAHGAFGRPFLPLKLGVGEDRPPVEGVVCGGEASETPSEDEWPSPAPARDGGTGRRLEKRAEIRAVFGQRRAFFVLRLWTGDIMELFGERPAALEGESAEDAWAADDADGAGPQLPPHCVGLASYGHSYFARGSGLPLDGCGWPRIRPRAFCGGLAAPGADGHAVYRSPSLHFWEPPSLPQPVRLSPNAYADRLRGIVIPTPENLKFEVTQAVMLREFASRGGRVTDLHFPPLEAQLAVVRERTRDAPLRSGDYFCTRHSNLGGVVQAAFHLLTGSSEAPASDEVPAATHRALKRIVCDCHRCHVAELSLPLLLLDIGTSESSLPYAIAQRRAENALRALKGALARLTDELASSEFPGLQVLNLVLPQSCTQSINAGIPSVAETTLTFLQHSYQCV